MLCSKSLLLLSCCMLYTGYPCQGMSQQYDNGDEDTTGCSHLLLMPGYESEQGRAGSKG